MRILITSIMTLILVLAFSTAGAGDLPQQPSSSPSFQDNSRFMSGPGITTLKLSPMYLEIKEVLDKAGETEQLLLKELAAATEDREVERIIHRIERLEVDSKLIILNIQIRYARMEGRWDLERNLRARIVKLMEDQAYALK